MTLRKCVANQYKFIALLFLSLIFLSVTGCSSRQEQGGKKLNKIKKIFEEIGFRFESPEFTESVIKNQQKISLEITLLKGISNDSINTLNLITFDNVLSLVQLKSMTNVDDETSYRQFRLVTILFSLVLEKDLEEAENLATSMLEGLQKLAETNRFMLLKRKTFELPKQVDGWMIILKTELDKEGAPLIVQMRRVLPASNY